MCCPDRHWTATADALFLHRSATRGPQLLSDPQSGNSLLDSSGLGFDYEAGPRLSLIHHGCAWDFELNYFGIDGWKADADFPNSAFPSGVGSLALDNAIPFPVTAASFEYKSRLYSAEFNVRRSVNDWLTGLAGFRWMELEDSYLAQGTGAILSTPFSEAIRSHNHLFGFQIGGRCDTAWTTRAIPNPRICQDRHLLQCCGTEHRVLRSGRIGYAFGC